MKISLYKPGVCQQYATVLSVSIDCNQQLDPLQELHKSIKASMIYLNRKEFTFIIQLKIFRAFNFCVVTSLTKMF